MTPRLSVCVCTFRRPLQLARLLEALAAQRDLTSPFEVIVVDNDADASAQGVVDGRRQLFEMPLVYQVEPRQNVALARNRTVSLARGDLVAFVDDDEVPEPIWLKALVEAAARFDGRVVFGPVLSRLPSSAPRWIVRGRFFDRPRHPTGADLPADEARTGNALVPRAWLAARVGPFDADFGRSGGEDTEFFEFLQSRGARFVWCDQALVYEDVPEDRCRGAWLLDRARRSGEAYVRLRAKRRGWAHGVYLAAAGAGTLLVAPALALVSLPWGVERAVWWLRKASAGWGRVLAVFGRRPVHHAT